MNKILEKFNKDGGNNNPLLGRHIKNGYIPGASIIPNWKDIRNVDTHPKRSYICNAYINKLFEIILTDFQ